MPRVWFPRPLQVTADGITYRFEAGMQLVPRALASHWWLAENGVCAIRPT